MLRHGTNLRFLWILILACGVLSFQAQGLLLDLEGHEHSSKNHCCGACHSGHTPLHTPADALTDLPPNPEFEWHVRSCEASSVHETLIAARHSRAPPA
jgi:hypothetical protein